MRYWLLQGDPDHLDIDTYLRKNDRIRWQVQEQSHASKMRPGDELFFWRMQGSTDKPTGIVAYGVLSSRARDDIGEDFAAVGLWHNPEKRHPEAPRVKITLHRKCLGTREVIKKQWLGEDPVFKRHQVLTAQEQTSFALEANEAARLAALVRNTNRDWTREESTAGLWAYAHTYGGPVSKLPGEPVARAAVAIGRAVSGVYNKVMNFRYLDPRDDRAGFPNKNQVDVTVWDQYFQQDEQQLDVVSLNTEFERLWGQPAAAPTRDEARPVYADFGEAPDDDPKELHDFATRVRRGQKRFRDNLLRLYERRCAITGDGPEEVLEAGHIIRHAESGINQVDNGLLLRADIHYLFDAGLLQVDPDTLTVRVDNELHETRYAELDGRELRSRQDGGRPSRQHLQERWAQLNRS